MKTFFIVIIFSSIIFANGIFINDIKGGTNVINNNERNGESDVKTIDADTSNQPTNDKTYSPSFRIGDILNGIQNFGTINGNVHLPDTSGVKANNKKNEEATDRQENTLSRQTSTRHPYGKFQEEDVITY